MLILHIIFLLSLTEPYPDSCDRVCRCYSNHYKSVADCSDSGLLVLTPSLSSGLDWLLLFNNNITSLSSGAFNKYDRVSLINMANNSLSSIPKSTQDLKSLTDLNLSHNSFVVFPSSVLHIILLVRLDLGYNQIESFPETIPETTSLTHLNVTHNHMKSISLAVLNMTSLIHLNMSHNHIKFLPQTIQKMTSLTHLDLSQNHITFLPRTIKDMTSLKDVRISFNNFECKCDITWLKYWISHNLEIIPDNKETKCKIGSKLTPISIMPERAMGCIKPNYYIPSWIIPGKLRKGDK